MTKRKTTAKAKTVGSIGSQSVAASLDTTSLTEALQMLIEPLATLSVARGMPFATVEEMLKKAFIDAALGAHASANAAAHRMVSRVSTVTGLTRREISRLIQADKPDAPMRAPRRSPATQVFTRWIAEPSLKAANGKPMALPRQGPAPSFEELARSVNRDVHPRSLLEELCRLGLVRVNGDTVHVVRESIVPKEDVDRMLAFLGNNVGDHLRAAVANVLTDPPQHLEQAVFADELSQASLNEFRQVVRAQWQELMQATVPLLHRLIEADQTAKRPQNQRVRVGMYMFSEPMVLPKGNSEAELPSPYGKPSTRLKRGK